jgi:hypothetical protein
MSAPERVEVNGESDVIRYKHELNRSAALQEIRRIADG